MNKKVGLIKFPDKWVSFGIRTEYDIFMLSVDGRCEVYKDLNNLSRNSKRYFDSLMSTLEIQVGHKKILENRKRLQKGSGRDLNNILEYKSSGGPARLFAFLDGRNNRIIICTNMYWKTSDDRKKQNAAFEKAEKLRKLYIEEYGEN